MEAENAIPTAEPSRPILVTLACLVGFAGVPMTAYFVIRNGEAIIAFNGWSFIVALICFGALGLAGLVGYWMMRRWGLYLYAAMTALSLGYALVSGSFTFSGSFSSIVITAIGCLYFARMR
jgi:uncharacterized membrane protein (DUF2068 family)